jgi:DDE superfamily endonuclease
VRVCCQDESRLGLPLPLHRRLTGYGVQPLQGVEPLSESYWLSAAVAPTTGEAFWWELPHLDAECFSLFLDKCGQCYAESLNSILLDQAPAHVAQRGAVPDNVVRMGLPAYSPELNPGERLWEDLKSRIAGVETRVRRTRAALQAHGAGLVQRSTAETIASLTGYAYLGEAICAL